MGSLPLWQRWTDPGLPVRVGVSACLLGEAVRADGSHCQDGFLLQTLAQRVELVPACPEVELGLGVPRAPLRLEAGDDGPRLVQPATGTDLTEDLAALASTLGVADLDGYVVKKGSPTCGLERVRLHRAAGTRAAGTRAAETRDDGVGLFTARLRERAPGLPIEEEGRLSDPGLRERFVTHLFARNRWRVAQAAGLTRGRLVEFHAAHKLLLRAHAPRAHRELGRWVASAGTRPDEELFAGYGERFERAFTEPAGAGAHVDVLQHAYGYLKRVLSAEERRALRRSLEDYRRGLVPRPVPLSLLLFHAREHDVPYLREQLYLDPYPQDLLRRVAA